MYLFPPVPIAAIVGNQSPRIPSEKEIEKAIACISNDDIDWTNGGPFTGVYPSPSRNVQIVLEMGEPTKSALLQALKDPKKFIAAHFLLVFIFHNENSPHVDSWNGLRVLFSWDGSSEKVVVDPKQVIEINEKWREFFAHESDRPIGIGGLPRQQGGRD